MPYEEQRTNLARLVQKGYFTDLDRKRILACLVNMRMICDSTFLFDKQTHVSPKLDEFAEVVPELLDAGRAQGRRLQPVGNDDAQGGRGARPRHRHACCTAACRARNARRCWSDSKTTRSAGSSSAPTPAGSGSTCRSADTVINLELPWNPAVLEQRIARVHRMGQNRPVRVINFVTRGSIEERVLRTLDRKQSLFAGLFNGDEDEIAFTAINPSTFANTLRTLLTDAPVKEPEERAAPAVDAAPLLNAAMAMLEALAEFIAKAEELPGEVSQRAARLSERLAKIAKH